ncbi:MAG: hypothetical protein IKG14_03220 [Clostridia bacterium]|nr:hypothetical protein [Clostridia bacterium]
MKKIIVFFVITIAFLGMIWYIYEEAKISQNEKIAFNNSFEKLLNKQISGNDLATIINRAVENNINNDVEKNSSGFFIDNSTNSMSIDIKFVDNDSVIKAEKLVENDLSKFIDLYNLSDFTLIKINYHEKTNLVKYLYFEESM